MTLLIKDYAGAQAALRVKTLRQALYDEGSVIMSDVLVNLHGDEHRVRRGVETQVFRRDFFRYYEAEVFPKTLVETLAPFLASADRVVDVVDFGYHVMVNLTADFTGVDRPKKSPAETQALIDLLRLFSRTAIIAHSTENREALLAEARAGLTRFETEYVAPSVARRRALLADFEGGRIAEEDLPRDVLTVLLQNEQAIALTSDGLLRETAFFGLAGAHTSIHSLGHALFEIFQWLERHPEDRARLEAEPAFVQRCVHESFRLHPSSPVAARRALSAVVLGTRALTSGERVDISLQLANRDPTVFGEDADEFNPHRELPKGVSPYGLSFGTGMHACLGLNLAAGVLPKGEGVGPDHQFGTVALIVHALLNEGAIPKPGTNPRKDSTTTRDLWGYLPVLLGAG